MGQCTFRNQYGKRCVAPVKSDGYCAIHRKAALKIIQGIVAEKNKYAVLGDDFGIPENHLAANPVSGLLWELRRTAAKIMACEEQIAKLTNREIVWGRTLEEIKDAATTFTRQGDPIDASYTLTRDQAKLDNWVELLMLERKHYTELCKIGIAAGLEERRIKVEEKTVIAFQRVITNVLLSVGKDPNDPDLRAMLRDEFIAIEQGV